MPDQRGGWVVDGSFVGPHLHHYFGHSYKIVNARIPGLKPVIWYLQNPNWVKGGGRGWQFEDFQASNGHLDRSRLVLFLFMGTGRRGMDGPGGPRPKKGHHIQGCASSASLRIRTV
eukprot:1151031-Pelagomonas_calceolata.AAC.12